MPGQEGIIAYSGHEGSVCLFAGCDVNLNFIRPQFTGQMGATAEGPIRVLLPPNFDSSFEASIETDQRFVCRADIAPQISVREDGDRKIFAFGAGPPVIRLTSLNGPIVIDNRDEIWEAANEAVMAQPRQPMLSTRASVRPGLISSSMS